MLCCKLIDKYQKGNFNIIQYEVKGQFSPDD